MQDKYNQAALLFQDDIRQKKKEKASLHEATKHKRLGKNSVRFASDLMSRGEKIKHRRASKIMTSNLYDTILPIDEFLDLEKHEQKNRMQYWRLKDKIKEIQTGMGIWNKRYYEILDDLELPRERGKGAGAGMAATKKRKAPITGVRPEKSFSIIEEAPAPIAPAPTPAPIQEVIVSGMHLIFNGTHSPEELQRQLLKYATLLDGESDEFYIELKIVQKPKKKEAEAV
jgi:hypothetical protein